MKKFIMIPTTLLLILLIIFTVTNGCSPVLITYCAAGCQTSWLGDGVCQSACNNAACYYDNGDCATPTTTPTYTPITTPTPTSTATVTPQTTATLAPTTTHTPTPTPTVTTPPIGSVTVSIDCPATINKSSGRYFHAYVAITEVTNFDAAAYDITYNPEVIRIESVSAGNIAGTTIPIEIWGYVPANTQGIVRIVNSIPPHAPSASGEGYLADIYFKVMGDPGDSSVISFVEGLGSPAGYLMIGNNEAIEIPAIWINGLITID